MLSCVFECGPVEAVAPAASDAVVRQEGRRIAVEFDGRPVEVAAPGEGEHGDRRRLRWLQRRLQRCADGSKRRARGLEQFRNVARRIRNRERDRHHKLTTMIVLGAGTIVVEGVCGEMLRQLEYKAQWYGRELQVRRGPPEPDARGDRASERSSKRESQDAKAEVV